MKVLKIGEAGYEEAALGFSLSYKSTMERTKQILPKYAFGISGERKFLESIIVYLDVTAPRYWWQEADTYRVGTTKQSESTMHTLMKKTLSQDDFEDGVFESTIAQMNILIMKYKNETDADVKKSIFRMMKNNLPEGYLQRRIWMVNYMGIQNMNNQRAKHRLKEWQYFLDTILSSIEHPEFIINNTEERLKQT